MLRSPDLVWGGLVIFLVTGTGAAATVAFRGLGGPAAMLVGCLALLAGAVMTLAAIETGSAAAFLAGGGGGRGRRHRVFLGAYRILTALAGPGQRAGLVAAIWVVFYLAFSVPVVAAGVATTHFGLHQTAEVYSAVLAVLPCSPRRPRASSCSSGGPCPAGGPSGTSRAGRLTRKDEADDRADHGACAGFAADAPGIVYFESPDEGQTIRDPATVAKIILTFDTLRSEALPRGASRDLIVKVAEEYGRDLA